MPSSPALRAYLDANILFSASYSEHSPFHLFWQIPGLLPVVSQYAINEVSRNVNSFAQRMRFRSLLENTQIVPDADTSCIPATVQLVSKDRAILAAAIANKADFLITGDINHFGHLYGTKVEGVEVWRPADFLLQHASRP